MSQEIVKFKGGRAGITLVFDKQAEYAAIEKDIKSKLLSGADFFRCGATILIQPGQLADEDEEKLVKLFHQFGVIVHKAEPEIPKEVSKPEAVVPKAEQKPVPDPVPEPPKNTVQEMTVIDYTLRSGQEVTAQGSVLICGNVNPGAQVIAGGSIDIRGTCRGIVHAGAYGDTSAFVIADRLMPVQIRIANYIAQAPDQMTKPNFAERASIKDGRIVIEPVER